MRKNSYLILTFIILFWSLFFIFGLDDYLSWKTIRHYHDLWQIFRDNNPLLASGFYIMIYILITTLSLPGGGLLSLVGGFIFGPFWGTCLIWIGANIGAFCIFILARTLLHTFLRRKTQGWLPKMQKGFARHAFNYLLFLRLVPLFPFVIMNVVPALLRIRTQTYVGATALGIIPGCFIYAATGNAIGYVSEQAAPSFTSLLDPMVFIPLLGLGLLALVPIWMKRRRT